MPLLPEARRERLAAAAGVEPAEVALVVDLGLDELVAAAIDGGAEPRLALTRAANEVAAHAGHDGPPGSPAGLDSEAFTKLLRMETDGVVTATQAKQVLGVLLTDPGASRKPAEIAAALGFEAMTTDALGQVVDTAIASHPDEWARLGAGEQKLMGFFVGKVMGATAGKADGKAVTALLRARLS
jgi:aspartyl-tRNA(Asn)/glutamyl-tRNA(Gln) amidotransferase subunit B